MFLLGIDYGTKNIGLAIGGSESIALPLKVIKNKGAKKVLEEIKKIVDEEKIDAIIVGLSLLKSGTVSEMAKEALGFGDFLSKNIPLPVKFQNELLTSKEVESLFRDLKKEKKKIEKDEIEAMVMLQSYIDQRK